MNQYLYSPDLVPVVVIVPLPLTWWTLVIFLNEATRSCVALVRSMFCSKIGLLCDKLEKRNRESQNTWEIYNLKCRTRKINKRINLHPRSKSFLWFMKVSLVIWKPKHSQNSWIRAWAFSSKVYTSASSITPLVTFYSWNGYYKYFLEISIFLERQNFSTPTSE